MRGGGSRERERERTTCSQIEVQAIDVNQFSFLKRNLVGRVTLRLTSVVTHLSIQSLGENSNSPSDPFTEKTGYDQIQDIWRGSYSVAGVRNAGFRAGGYPGAGCVAFYYPNNDVLNGGRPTAAAGLDARTPELFGSGGPAMASSADGASCARYRSYDPASGTFLGRDGTLASEMRGEPTQTGQMDVANRGGALVGGAVVASSFAGSEASEATENTEPPAQRVGMDEDARRSHGKPVLRPAFASREGYVPPRPHQVSATAIASWFRRQQSASS
jgi:hypothetical protein